MKQILIAALLALSTAATAQEVNRSIEPVAGDVYLMRNNFHNSLLVATSEGVVRVDPINADAGAWLNDNLGDLGDNVTHLIYSHSHGDHGSGGDAHPDATVIAHEDAPNPLNGTEVDVAVGDSHVLQVGAHSIELTDLGAGHDNHMLVVVVRPENVAFIVDVAAPERLPFRDFPRSDVDGWISQIEAAQALDFEIFAPGHGAVGSKADLDDAHAYMVELRAEVLAGLKAGKSVEDLQGEITMADYASWGQYEAWLPLNILGMAGYLVREGKVN